jgi:hypothetical protein
LDGVAPFSIVKGKKFRAVDSEEVPGEVVVSTEKLARGMTNDLILPVQYFVFDAILDVFCRYGEHFLLRKLADEESGDAIAYYLPA